MNKSTTAQAATITDPLQLIELGHSFAEKKQYKDSEHCFRKAIKLHPQSSTAHNNLGQVYYLQGKIKQAIDSFQKALQLDPSFELAVKNLAEAYTQNGRYDEAKKIILRLLKKNPASDNLLEQLTNLAMNAGYLRDAARYAEKLAALRFSYNNGRHSNEDDSCILDEHRLTIQKLIHDIEQFRYLKQQGIRIRNIDTIIENYGKVLKSIRAIGPETRVGLSKNHMKLIGNEYNRIIYRPHIPRVRRALSDNWDVVSSVDSSNSAEKDFQLSKLGLSVIDNFLTPAALHALRKFCLESTIWFENRYAYGRLGAFFRQGFNCPLLVQIGEEVKKAFPNIIGDDHSLLQIWGFKCSNFQPFVAPHADFAAVNVNFWITPDEANLDPESGGMVMYDIEAPLSWDFDSYNNQGNKIITYLKKNKARSVNIPYKANRAIIFNSDLFHATSAINFKNAYESRRVNVTMLYGKRENAKLA